MSEGELILYNTDDGAATIGLRAIDGTVWLTQLEMAEALVADADDIVQLEEVENAAKGRKKGGGDA